MKYCLQFILFLSFIPSISQELTFVDKSELAADMFVGFDSYKNLYYVKEMVFYKEGANGNYQYNDFQLGNITSVDIINPLKIVLFYEDLNTVVLVDNKLTEIERINFSNLQEYITVSAATNAGNNTLWLFNVDSQQLELYNYRTQRKNIVSQPFEGKLLSQRSNFNYCFTLTENSLRTFNSYGSLLSEVPSLGWTRLVQENENLVLLKENDLFLMAPLKDNQVKNVIQSLKFSSEEITVKDLQLTQDFLYIYDGNSVHTFTLTQPKQ